MEEISMKFSVRLSQADERKLEELAGKRGMTPSDLIRDLIRTGYDRQAVSEALKEVKAAAAGLAARNQSSGGSEDIAEIRRIVTLIGKAMPAVAKSI